MAIHKKTPKGLHVSNCGFHVFPLGPYGACRVPTTISSSYVQFTLASRHFTIFLPSLIKTPFDGS